MTDQDQAADTVRDGGKSALAFRTISEVAEDLDVFPHVLRFWESKFSEVRPLKLDGRRRYYSPDDVALLRRIRTLLYNDGYTIKGVQKLLREENGGSSPGGETASRSARMPRRREHGVIPADRRRLEALRDELKDLRRILASPQDA